MTTLAPSAAPVRTPLRLSPAALAPLGMALLALAAVMFTPQALNDGDTYWHLAAGQWMLDHGRVPRVDVFSFPHLGKPWVAQEWLSEVLMALAYRAGGWSGLVALYGAATALAMGLLTGRLGRALRGLTLAVALALIVGCAAPSLLIRPHLLILPVIIAWTTELLAARAEGRAPRLFLAGLMLLWANLHGSYLLGFVLAGPFGLEALAEAKAPERLRVLREWVLVGGLCVAASLLTPHGLAGVTYPFEILSMTTLGAITEWRAADFSKLAPFELALLVTLFVGFSRGLRVPPLRLALLLILLHMALQHERQLIILAVVAPLLLVEPLAEALDQRATAMRPGHAAWAAFALGAAVLLGLRFAFPLARQDGATTPASALEHVPAALAARPVINTYGFGGYLIFKGVRPFIDGRSDMYGDAHFKRDLAIMAGDRKAFDAAVAQYGVAWTLLAPDEALVGVLDATPGWRRLYADRYAVVHIRD